MNGVLAITGATGFVGRTLLEEALAEGWRIRALARQDQEPQSGVDWVRGDLADAAALARLCTGAVAVIHVAGVVNAAAPAAFEAGNVAGTQAVVTAARGAGVARLIHVSSLTAREPMLSVYGASKARAEAIVAASGPGWTIVRPPAVYGPRDTEMFELFRLAARGVIPVPREGRTSIIHARDLARLLLALVPAGPDAHGRIFEPDDGNRPGWTHGQLAAAIGWAVGRKVLIVRLSPRAMRLAARLDRLVRGGKAKLSADRVGYMTHPDWVASPAARVPAPLWRPIIATSDGLRETARWYRAQGWL